MRLLILLLPFGPPMKRKILLMIKRLRTAYLLNVMNTFFCKQSKDYKLGFTAELIGVLSIKQISF